MSFEQKRRREDTKFRPISSNFAFAIKHSTISVRGQVPKLLLTSATYVDNLCQRGALLVSPEQ